jgi:hypothetical protein
MVRLLGLSGVPDHRSHRRDFARPDSEEHHMPSLRILQIMPVVGLAAAALVVSGAPSGSAHPTSAKLTMPNCHNTIHGVVVDQGGKKVDDVNVEAFNAKGGDPQASALTYANPDNDVKHGYFDLCVGRGTYTVKLSKDGYKTRNGIDAGYLVWYGVHNSYLGELKLKKNMEDSTAKVTLSKDSIKVGDDAKGTVKITTGGAVPTGKWQILVDGDKEDSGKLKESDNGKFSFSVSGLSRGTHKIQASYDGDVYVNGSDSKKVAIDVVKKKR